MSGAKKNAPALLSPLAADTLLPGGPDGVLLIHGFTGSPAHMRPLGEYLNQHGFTVRLVRLTGHGTDIGDMLKASRADWLNDVRTALRELRAACRTVSVAGLSMGGVLSLILAQENPALRACVALSAPMGVTNPFSKLAAVLSHLTPVLNKKPGDEVRLLSPEYDIGYNQIPTARVADLNRLIALARENLNAIRCPLMCVQSLSDRIITKDSADVILNGVSSPVRERLTLKISPHVITIGPETGTLFPAVLRFLQAHTA